MLDTVRISFLALAAALLLSAFSGAEAAEAAGRLQGRVGVHGELITIAGPELTVQGKQGSVRVLVDEHTFIRIIGEAKPSMDDLEVGDKVLARGMRQEDGAILAAFVAREPEGDRRIGRVLSISDDSLVLSTPDGVEIEASVDAETIVAVGARDHFWYEGGRAVIREGMPLFAYGETSSSATRMEVHTFVAIKPLRRYWARRGLAGQITAVHGEGFTLETLRDETIAVWVDEDTRYHVPYVPEADLDDFDIDDDVVLLGKRTGDEAFLARHVLKRPQGRPVVGTLQSIQGDELFLINRTGLRLTVTVDESTRYRVGTDTSGSLGDFSVGNRVLVFGKISGDGTEMQAGLVARRQRAEPNPLAPSPSTAG